MKITHKTPKSALMLALLGALSLSACTDNDSEESTQTKLTNAFNEFVSAQRSFQEVECAACSELSLGNEQACLEAIEVNIPTGFVDCLGKTLSDAQLSEVMSVINCQVSGFSECMYSAEPMCNEVEVCYASLDEANCSNVLSEETDSLIDVCFTEGCLADGSCVVCANGEQIPSDYLCDGFDDCTDGSDEVDCTYFVCGDGEEIAPSWQCDGEEDCTDGSDEQGC